MIDMQPSFFDSFIGPEWPSVIAAKKSDNQILLHLKINAGLAWFAGHFPQQPVLPGVVQLHWAQVFARHVFSDELLHLKFQSVNNLKFKTMVMPNQSLVLSLTYYPEKSSVKVCYQSEYNSESSGSIFSTASIKFCPL